MISYYGVPMNPVMLFTLSGPVVGGLGYLGGIVWLVWAGVILCAINLFMNLASGVMKLPLLPVVAIVVGCVLVRPWYVGAAYGLLVYTAIEGIGELIGFTSRSRPN